MANEWQDSLRIERFTFQKIGDKLVGKLLAVDPVEVTDEKSGEVKMVKQIVVETVTSAGLKKYCFLESADMRHRIPVENVGMGIWVEYEGKSSTVGQDKGNAMGLFAIKFKQPVTA
jgi:hypothetical protein